MNSIPVQKEDLLPSRVSHCVGMVVGNVDDCSRSVDVPHARMEQIVGSSVIFLTECIRQRATLDH